MPPATMIDTAKVLRALENRAASGWAMAVGHILFGLAATVVVPPVLTVAMAFFGRGVMIFFPAFVAMMVLMAVAYVVEWTTRGGYLMNRLREIQSNDGGWYEAILHDRTWRYDARGQAAFLELFLFVPRMVFEGVHRM